jgi:hypothetical protein
MFLELELSNPPSTHDHSTDRLDMQVRTAASETRSDGASV